MHHIVGTGQSLALGSQTTAATTRPVDSNLRLNTTRTGLEWLHEPTPRGSGETIHSAMGGEISELASSHQTLHTTAAKGNCEYDCLKKNGSEDPFQLSIDQVNAAENIAAAWSCTHTVEAVTLVHGEKDHNIGTTTYYTDMIDLQDDYETDVQAATGQVAALPLFLSQFSAWTDYGDTTSLIPYAQLDAALDDSDIYLVGPKYALPYAADGLHLTAAGYQQLGEYYGHAYHQTVVDSSPWTPLYPSSVARSGAVITITFSVPTTPLVLDTTTVSNPGDYGFEFYDDSGPSETIQSVALSGNDKVIITLTGAPSGAGKRIRYAYTGSAGNDGGPTTGPRGNLRDSDATSSRLNFGLWNWCVHFDEAVP